MTKQFKKGDRIFVNRDFVGGATKADNTSSKTPIEKNMQGVIVGFSKDKEYPALNSFSCWIVRFDQIPNEELAFAPDWLELIIVQPAASSCSCTLPALMAHGCMCGHIKRYVPPHKRIMEIPKKDEVKNGQKA